MQGLDGWNMEAFDGEGYSGEKATTRLRPMDFAL